MVLEEESEEEEVFQALKFRQGKERDNVVEFLPVERDLLFERSTDKAKVGRKVEKSIPERFGPACESLVFHSGVDFETSARVPFGSAGRASP